jgi:hypothetical protein
MVLEFEESEWMRKQNQKDVKIRGLLVTGCLVVLIVASMGRGAHRQPALAQTEESEWSEPLMLSSSAAHSWFADLVVEGQDRLHVVWDGGLPPSGPDSPGQSLTMHSVREQDGTWSDSNDISTGSRWEVSRPAIALDRAGVLHMAFRPWADICYTQADIAEAHSAYAWSATHRLSQSINYRPEIAVDSQGVIHVVWYEWVPVEFSAEEIFREQRSAYLSDVFYRRSADGGVTWSAPLNLSRTPNVGSGRVEIAIDGQDGIHVVWEEGWDRNARSDVAGDNPVCGMYAHSLDGGFNWSIPEVFDMPAVEGLSLPDAYAHFETGLGQLLSRIDRYHPRYSEALVYYRWLVENISRAQMEEERAQGTDDARVFAAERALADLETERETIINRLNELASLVLDTSFDALCDVDEITTGQEVIEALPQADNAQMTIGIGRDDDVLVVWRSRGLRRLYYTWSEDRGVTWRAAEEVPDIYARPWIEPFDAYDMATDSLGNIHFVLVGTPQVPVSEIQDVPLGVYHLTWDGESWSQPESVVDYLIPTLPEYPKIEIGWGNHLHVVWGVRPEGVWDEAQQIWYSEKEIEAPREEPEPTLTPTATPLPPSPTSLAPTMTPFPTLGPESSGAPPGLYTESDDLARLALALSPVVLIMVVALAIKRMRRL